MKNEFADQIKADLIKKIQAHDAIEKKISDIEGENEPEKIEQLI